MDEILNIFDDNLNIIGQETRNNVHKMGYLHEVVHCWLIENTAQGRYVYLQQREDFKDFPLRYDIAVGGHVDAGEKIETAVLREIQEELGLYLNIEDLKYEGFEIKDLSFGDFLDKEISRIYTYMFEGKINLNPGPEVRTVVKIREQDFIDTFLNGGEGVNIINLETNEEQYKNLDSFCTFGTEYNTILNNRKMGV